MLSNIQHTYVKFYEHLIWFLVRSIAAQSCNRALRMSVLFIESIQQYHEISNWSCLNNKHPMINYSHLTLQIRLNPFFNSNINIKIIMWSAYMHTLGIHICEHMYKFLFPTYRFSITIDLYDLYGIYIYVFTLS